MPDYARVWPSAGSSSPAIQALACSIVNQRPDRGPATGRSWPWWGARARTVNVRLVVGTALLGLLPLTGFGTEPEPAAAAPTEQPAPGGPGSGEPGGVTDHVRLGDPRGEDAHDLVSRGRSRPHRATVDQGQLSEHYTARSVIQKARFTTTLEVPTDQPLTLQFREVRPNHTWGASYGFRVFLDGQLHHVRDPAEPDPGGGPFHSFFLSTADPDLLADGTVEVTVEGSSVEPTYVSDIWAYADLPGFVGDHEMRVPDRVNFVLGQDYASDDVLADRLDYITENVHASDEVELGMAILDYFPVRSPAEMAANYQRNLRLSREYDLPFAIESTSDWEGTPTRVPDGDGGYFGDLQYQQVLWSPQDATGPDRDVYVNPDAQTQRLADLLGDDYDPRHGLSVPNIWGDTPWLTWHHPKLNAYYERKARQSMEQVRPLVWELQRTGEESRVLPFSTANESVYWARRDGVGVADDAYTEYNDGIERVDLYADYNPHTVAAAARDGVELDPRDGLSEEEKDWLYRNQSHHQQLFTDMFYEGLPRERIRVEDDRAEFPADMLRHNIHTEIYSRMQEPYYSGTFPSTAQGVVERGRPGAQYITLDDYNPGGFAHLQRLREFGRIANPNLETSVSGHAPDRTMLLRHAHVNGSRYTSPYNWDGTDVAEWVNAFVDDLHPWDVVHDAEPDGELAGRTLVSQEFTAGELRLADRVQVRLRSDGTPAPLRMTLYDGPNQDRVVALRHLSGSEATDGDWASFTFPVVELDRDHTYYLEIEQVGDDDPAYVFPTADGQLLHRVGLDMRAERDRSLVIQWRRDAADTIRHVTDELTTADNEAADTLADARQALAADRYVDAYRLAIKADAQRFPVLYQTTGGAAELTPFGVRMDADAELDVDVTNATGAELGFAVRGYADGPVEVAVDGFADHDVHVDGEPVDASSTGRRLEFTVDLAADRRYQVRIG